MVHNFLIFFRRGVRKKERLLKIWLNRGTKRKVCKKFSQTIVEAIGS